MVNGHERKVIQYDSKGDIKIWNSIKEANYHFGSTDRCKSIRASCSNHHRLIAETFLPNPENKLTVDHINRIRNDNRLWFTHKEQQKKKTDLIVNKNVPINPIVNSCFGNIEKGASG